MDKIKQIGAKWKELDNTYDNLIQDLIDNPPAIPLSEEKIKELKKMQEELYKLEVQLFNNLQ